MNLALEPQVVLHIVSGHNQSAMLFTALPASNTLVITNQYNNPTGLHSSENISNFNNAVEWKTSGSGEEANSRPLALPHPSRSLIIEKESEVYRMLQKKQELNEPSRPSTSFLILQEILESDEKGDPNKPSGFRTVKAPVTKVAASVGNAQKLPICDKCGTGIVGVFVKMRDHHCYPECYCLSQGFYFCTNIMTKKQVVKERVYSAYTSTLLFITQGSQDQNSSRAEAGEDAEDMEGYCLLACLLSWLSYRTQDYQPTDGTTHKGPSPLDH